MTEITQPILDSYLKAYNDVRDGVPGRHREAHIAGLQAAFLAAQEPAAAGVVGWHPIETAPKDRDILVFDADAERVVMARWNSGIWAGGSLGFRARVTRWHPLPAAPGAALTPADPKTPDAATGGSVGDGGLREAITKAERALKPFANRVYNDNGDVSVSDTFRCGLDEFTAAYFAHRTCVSALAPQPPKAETPAGVGEIAQLRIDLEVALDNERHWHGLALDYNNQIIALKNERDAALSTAPAARPGDEVETFETIRQWCEDTFGPITPERTVERASEEFEELRAEPNNVTEAADVVIVLSRYPGLWAEINRKMGINRARKWRLMGDGTGYHVKDVPAAAPAADGGRA